MPIAASIPKSKEGRVTGRPRCGLLSAAPQYPMNLTDGDQAMIESTFTRAELDEAAKLISDYVDKIDTFAGWSYMAGVDAAQYRVLAGQFLAAYEHAIDGEPYFPVGNCIYIDRQGDGFRMIADPQFSILHDAIVMGPDPFVSTSGNRPLWRLAAKFYGTTRWQGDDAVA
jgi:hypothetical protein